MYCTHLTSQEIEQATAEYHMYKDMSAMATRIDQLEAENDRLQRALLNRKLIPKPQGPTGPFFMPLYTDLLDRGQRTTRSAQSPRKP